MAFGFSDWALLLASLLGVAIYYLWRKNQFFRNLNLNYDKPNLAVGSMLKVYLQKRHIMDLFQDIYDRFPNDRYEISFFFEVVNFHLLISLFGLVVYNIFSGMLDSSTL